MMAVARTVNPTDFGNYAALLLVMYFVSGLISAFVIQVFQVHISTKKHQNQYITFSFWTYLFLMFFASGMISVLYSFFSISIPVELFFSLMLGFLLHDYFRKTFLSLQKIKQVFLLDLLFSIGQVAAFLFFFFYTSTTIENFIICSSLGYILPFLAGFLLLKPFHFNAASTKEWLKLHFRQGKWLVGTAVVQWWASNLFVVASGVYLGVQALGALRLGQSLFGILNLLLQTFENYVLPNAARLLKESEIKAYHYIKKVSLFAGFAFLPMLVLGFFAGEQIIVLAGGIQYQSFGFVIQGLSLLYVFIYFAQPIRILMRIHVLNKFFFMGYLLTLGFAMITSNSLISTWGLSGVISGLIVSQLLLIVYWYWILNRNKISVWKLFTSY